MSRLKMFIHEIRPNAAWDILKGLILLGIATITIPLLHFLQRLRGLPHDVVIDLVVFVVALLLVGIPSILLWRKNEKEVINTQARSPETLITQESAVVEKPILVPCHDKWLHDIAESHRTGIDRFVYIKECSIINKDFSRPIPFISFDFSVKNGSLYSITIEDTLDGFIELYHPQLDDDYRLGGQLLLKGNRVKDCSGGNTGRFIIEQRLSREEAELLSSSESPKAKFKFDRLFITVVGADALKQVVPQQLQITMGIYLDGTAFELFRT
jgi:hypothetical protein